MQKVIDTGKVLMANLIASAITLADILTIVQIASWALAIAYTIWKWNREARDKTPPTVLVLLAAIPFLFSGCAALESALFDRRDIVTAVPGHTYSSPSGDWHEVPTTYETNKHLSVKPSVVGTLATVQAVNDAVPSPFAPIIGGVLTLATAGLGWYARRQSKAGDILIEAIETANKPEVKAAVQQLSRAHGLSDFIHKKVTTRKLPL